MTVGNRYELCLLFERFVPLNYRLYKLKSAGNYFKSMMSIEDVKHLLTNKIIFSNNSLGRQNGTHKKISCASIVSTYLSKMVPCNYEISKVQKSIIFSSFFKKYRK